MVVPSPMINPQADVAIIGAGVSGLAAAWRLSQAGIRSVVFEKSRGLSGRAATRRTNGHHYDHGANFFRLDDPLVANLLQHALSADGLVEIPGDVRTFDAKGIITPGDPTQNAIPKWTYRDGISTLGKQLLAASPLTHVTRETRITRIGKTNETWWLEGANGDHLGSSQHLILTIPPPQCAELLRTSAIEADLTALLDQIPYHPQFSFILGYDHPPLRNRDFHALVNSNGGHPLAWLSFEEDKPGHVAGEASVMVAQMSPAWTTTHYETPPEKLLEDVVQIINDLLECKLPGPTWWDSQRWRYAHPVRINHPPASANVEDVHSAWRGCLARNLHLAGDGLVGKGRIPLAIRSGLEAAERIIATP